MQQWPCLRGCRREKSPGTGRVWGGQGRAGTSRWPWWPGWGWRALGTGRCWTLHRQHLRPGHFRSSDAASSVKPSEFWALPPEALCFSGLCIMRGVDSLRMGPFALLAFLPSSSPSLALGFTKMTNNHNNTHLQPHCPVMRRNFFFGCPAAYAVPGPGIRSEPLL